MQGKLLLQKLCKFPLITPPRKSLSSSMNSCVNIRMYDMIRVSNSKNKGYRTKSVSEG